MKLTKELRLIINRMRSHEKRGNGVVALVFESREMEKKDWNSKANFNRNSKKQKAFI